MRARRVQRDATASYAGRSWTGDVWEVSVQDLGTGQLWVVGRQLLAGVGGAATGVRRHAANRRMPPLHGHLTLALAGRLASRPQRPALAGAHKPLQAP